MSAIPSFAIFGLAVVIAAIGLYFLGSWLWGIAF